MKRLCPSQRSCKNRNESVKLCIVSSKASTNSFSTWVNDRRDCASNLIGLTLLTLSTTISFKRKTDTKTPVESCFVKWSWNWFWTSLFSGWSKVIATCKHSIIISGSGDPSSTRVISATTPCCPKAFWSSPSLIQNQDFGWRKIQGTRFWPNRGRRIRFLMSRNEIQEE